METEQAVTALAALAHDSRLAVFRLLVQAAPDPLSAGELAARLEIPAPTLSFHLAQLKVAGLLVSRREGRSILYAIRVAGMQELLGFLTDDCCQGRPELCQPGAASLACCEDDASCGDDPS